MWDLINQFIPRVSETFINLAELGLIVLVGYGFVKFVCWATKKFHETETPKTK